MKRGQKDEYTDTFFRIYSHTGAKLSKFEPKLIFEIRGNSNDMKFENLNISNGFLLKNSKKIFKFMNKIFKFMNKIFEIDLKY